MPCWCFGYLTFRCFGLRRWHSDALRPGLRYQSPVREIAAQPAGLAQFPWMCGSFFDAWFSFGVICRFRREFAESRVSDGNLPDWVLRLNRRTAEFRHCCSGNHVGTCVTLKNFRIGLGDYLRMTDFAVISHGVRDSAGVGFCRLWDCASARPPRIESSLGRLAARGPCGSRHR